MATKPPVFSEIAAVDLGSNSFRLQLARIIDGRLVFHDSLRETVRLGAGLGKDKELDADAQHRAIDCLRRFGERLRGLPAPAVRVVATNTFRVAKNAQQLLSEAQAALGFPIEIIAGREEARMIFVGVSHSLPSATHKRMVIDIGGGSTEFIIGQGFEPLVMESLYMGCVGYSLKFFPEGKVSEASLNQAEIAAAAEIQNIRKRFACKNWQEAVGSSGTAHALAEVMRLNGLSDGTITLHGIRQLRNLLIKAKDTKKLHLKGLSAERAAVLPGGLAIMSAAFEALNIEHMATASGALRDGVLYELLGRMHHQDTRQATVNSFMRKYHVDRSQAKRIEKMALQLLAQVSDKLDMGEEAANRYLVWAAKLHEVGISIAHNGYHRHSAYIVEYADMPGFSTMDQKILALLMRTQRRSLNKFPLPGIEDDRCLLVLILRLSILFHRNRLDSSPHLKLKRENNEFRLSVQKNWLGENPLTQASLDNEVAYWQQVGIELKLG